MKHWMFKCREVSRMISESMDRKLPLHHRIMIRIHLAMCKYCARFKRQIQLMQAACRRLEAAVEGPDAAAVLSPEARERIASAIKNAAP